MPLRICRRLIAISALAVWFAGISLPLLVRHESERGDPGWAAALWSSPHPVTQFEAPRPQVDDGHCALCHWQRAVTDASGALLRAPGPRDRGLRLHGDVQLQRLSGNSSRLVSRGPPRLHL